ncbi:hypothetical protein HPPN120_06345 [Helicobacter pylori Puno120]|nr:hypothetical protein HPPN120_06345 [Helicobacter pylori Puno120]
MQFEGYRSTNAKLFYILITENVFWHFLNFTINRTKPKLLSASFKKMESKR